MKGWRTMKRRIFKETDTMLRKIAKVFLWASLGALILHPCVCAILFAGVPLAIGLLLLACSAFEDRGLAIS
jgi:hypothetical protein